MTFRVQVIAEAARDLFTRWTLVTRWRVIETPDDSHDIIRVVQEADWS